MIKYDHKQNWTKPTDGTKPGHLSMAVLDFMTFKSTFHYSYVSLRPCKGGLGLGCQMSTWDYMDTHSGSQRRASVHDTPNKYYIHFVDY
jgi:hypothetical protein